MTLKNNDIKKIANYTNRNKKRFEPDLINTIEKGKALPFASHSSFPGQNMELFDNDYELLIKNIWVRTDSNFTVIYSY